MKLRQFSPAVDALESRTVLSGISTSTLARVDEAFQVFKATRLFNEQQISAANQADATLTADKAKVAADKVQVFTYFANLEAASPGSVNLPFLSNALFNPSSTITGTALAKAGLINNQVTGATSLVTDEATLKTDQAAATKTLDAKFSQKAAIDTLATNLLNTVGTSKASLIRADITGAPQPNSVLLTTATSPSKGSLAAELSNSVPGAIDAAEIKFLKDLISSK